MADYPLLPLPAPVRRKVSGRRRGGGEIRLPDRERQGERFGPVFERLRRALDPDHPLMFGEDPAGIAPERALVFEIAGSVTGFHKAIAEYLQQRLKDSPDSEHRVEVELWSSAARERREHARRRFREALGEAGGRLVHRASIPEVAYEAALIDVPAAALRRMTTVQCGE